MTLDFSLRDYQTEALDAIAAALSRGVRRLLLAHPTGCGKTVTFCAFIRQHVTAGRRALVLVHRDELAEQTVHKLGWIAPHLTVGVVKAERNELDADVVVASVQTVAQPHRLAQLSDTFDVVIVDETHHVMAATWLRVLDHVGARRAGGPIVLGVTATPNRTDGVGLAGVYETIIHELTILPMMQAGYLCDVVPLRVRVQLDWSAVRKGTSEYGRDYTGASLERALMDANTPKHIALAYLEHAVGRDRKRTLIFTPGVEMAQAVQTEFHKLGFRCGYLDGETPAPTRRALLREFSAGTMPAVVNCGVLTEGYDEPLTDCLIIARPTQSRLLYTQIVGRGLRRGKDYCLLLDVCGVTDRHELMAAHTLLGLAGIPEKGETVLEAQARVKAEKEAAHLDALSQARIVAEQVDVFKRKHAAHWVEGPNRELFVMYLGKAGGTVYLMATDDTRTAYVVRHKPGRAADGSYPPVRTLHEGVPWLDGVAVAEQHVRTVGSAFTSSEMKRQGAPEGFQVAFLSKARLPVPSTYGAAADLMALAGAVRAEHDGQIPRGVRQALTTWSASR